VYLEPFFGSGAVFFNKPPSKVETINDIDGQVVNLFRVIRERPEELARLVGWTPWVREEYYASFEETEDPVERERRFLVRAWQARASDLSKKVGWRHERQGKQGRNAGKVWDGLPERILRAAERLKQAQIENQDALILIERYRLPEVLIYADPPYPRSTRSNDFYTHEMTDADHLELLDALDKHPGPVLLSGYACPLYDDRLKHWDRKTARAIVEGGRERQEVLWLNPVAVERLGAVQQRMEFL
jgi:DNA adenine methylase